MVARTPLNPPACGEGVRDRDRAAFSSFPPLVGAARGNERSESGTGGGAYPMGVGPCGAGGPPVAYRQRGMPYWHGSARRRAWWPQAPRRGFSRRPPAPMPGSNGERSSPARQPCRAGACEQRSGDPAVGSGSGRSQKVFRSKIHLPKAGQMVLLPL
jgi:hypothetical protein